MNRAEYLGGLVLASLMLLTTLVWAASSPEPSRQASAGVCAISDGKIALD